MTERGDPYENAIAERVNGILKHEFGLDDDFSDFDQASTSEVPMDKKKEGGGKNFQGCNLFSGLTNYSVN